MAAESRRPVHVSELRPSSLLGLVAAVTLCGCFAVQPLPVATDSETDSSSGSTRGSTSSTGAMGTSSGTESSSTGASVLSTESGSGSTSATEDSASEATTSDPICGNGRVEGDEACDDGVNDGGYDGCVQDCSARGPYCGDGEAQEVEACDDGNEVVGDGCNPYCAVSGTVVWEDVFSSNGSSSFDTALEVRFLDDGDVLAAVSSSARSGELDVLLRRYSAAGRLVSSTLVQGLDPSWGASRVSLGDDGSYALAQAAMFSGTVLHSYDADNTQLWSRPFQDASDLELDVMPSGHVFYGESNGFDAAVVGRIDSSGNTAWQNTLIEGGNSHTYSVARAPNGDLFAVGYHIPSSAALVQRRSALGAELWTTDFGPIPTDISISADTDDGGAICWGDADTTGVTRFGADGASLWSAEYITVGGTSARCRDLVVLESGAVMTIGQGYDDGVEDILVVRFSEASGVQWSHTFAGTDDGLDVGWAIDEMQDGRVVVAGRVTNEGSGADAWVAALEP